MKKSYIKRVSKKQVEKNKKWREVTDQKAKELNNTCQWCGQYGRRDDPYNPLDGHHIIKRRYGVDALENCFVVHRIMCHPEADKVELEYPDKNRLGLMFKYLEVK